MAASTTCFLAPAGLVPARVRSARRLCRCAVSRPPPPPAAAPSPSVSRRSFLASAAAAVAATATASMAGVAGVPPPAGAYEDVPQLPPGARQLDNLLKARKQWEAIGVTVQERHEVMDATEWNNVRTYLRKFYSVGDDMVALGKGRGKESKQAVEAIAKSLRKTVKDMDKPAAVKDWEAFLVAHAAATTLVDDFFGYLKSSSDIPDEL